MRERCNGQEIEEMDKNVNKESTKSRCVEQIALMLQFDFTITYG